MFTNISDGQSTKSEWCCFKVSVGTFKFKNQLKTNIIMVMNAELPHTFVGSLVSSLNISDLKTFSTIGFKIATQVLTFLKKKKF